MNEIPVNPLNPPIYRLLGGPGSPYSLKMRAVFRYRRIPHLWIVPRGYLGSEGELHQAGKGMIPVLQYPEGGYHADSTPLVYDLERRHPGQRSVMPDDTGAAFLSHLIEDMADELLVTALFDLRWGLAADQNFCATRQLSGWLGPIDRVALDALVAQFTRRQTRLREKLVSSEDTHQLLMLLYTGVLDVIEHMQERTAYLFGDRPSLADFGLYGQLSQCALDPSASAIMRTRAPRTFQWTQSLDDACGVEGDWVPQHVWEPGVRKMLELVGRHYLPLLHAHYTAVEAGDESFEVDILGRSWRGLPERYKHKCLTWLRREWDALSPDVQMSIRPLLNDTGCLATLEARLGANLHVAEMAPL